MNELHSSSIYQQHVLLDKYLSDYIEVAIVLKDIVFLGIYNRLVFLKKLKRIRLLITIVIFILFKNSFPRAR